MLKKTSKYHLKYFAQDTPHKIWQMKRKTYDMTKLQIPKKKMVEELVSSKS